MPRQRATGFVRVAGLKDLQKALREVDKKLPRELGTASQKVAQHIVNEATAKARGVGPLQAKAAKSMKAARQQRVAAINYGGAKYPFAMGAEFGAIQDIPRDVARAGTQYQVAGWNQFRPWRGNSTNAGYFLFPTVRSEGDRIVDLFGEQIDDLIARYF